MMKTIEPTYQINLTYGEITKISKFIKNPEGKEEILKALKENDNDFPLIAFKPIISKALQKMQFTVTHKYINSCLCCGKYYNWIFVPKEKRKGFYGYAFNEGSITLEGEGHLCRSCDDKHGIIKKIITYIYKKELPIEIRVKGYKTRYIIKQKYKCSICKQVTYYTHSEYRKCPKCGCITYLNTRYGKPYITRLDKPILID